MASSSTVIDGRKLIDLKVADLRQQLESRGLDTKGLKTELVERLEKALNEAENSESSPVAFPEVNLESRGQGMSSTSVDSPLDDASSGLVESFANECTQIAAENETRDTTQKFAEKSEFSQFLELIEKLTNDIRDLQAKVSNGQDRIEKLISENCELKLENLNLKLIGNGKTSGTGAPSSQNYVISEDSNPKINLSSPPLNNAGIVNGNKDIINRQVMQVKKKRPNKKRRAKLKKSQMSPNNSDEKRGNHPINASIIVIENEKSGEAANNVNCNINSDDSSEIENAGNGKTDGSKSSNRNETRKETTIIVGDSMVKNVNGWDLKKKCASSANIYVKSFSGSTIDDMKSYVEPSIARKPNRIILHVGTNDLGKEKSDVDIASGIITLAKYIKSHGIQVVVSGLVPRYDKLEPERVKVNFVLRDMCNVESIEYLDHSNIDPSKHLNRSKLHLNSTGDGIMADNLFKATISTPGR